MAPPGAQAGHFLELIAALWSDEQEPAEVTSDCLHFNCCSVSLCRVLTASI